MNTINFSHVAPAPARSRKALKSAPTRGLGIDTRPQILKVRRMNPSRIRRALGGLFVGVVLVGVVELMLRFTLAPEPPGTGSPIFVADAEAGFRLAPNLQFDGFHTNSLGMRAPEPREDANERILVLGDSMTLGLEVRDEETFCYQWQQRVSSNIQILNGGCSAYGPVEELAALKRLGPVVRPTSVVLMFFPLNDIYDSAHEASPFRVMGGRLVEAEKYEQAGVVARFFKNFGALAWSTGWMRGIRKLTKKSSRGDAATEPGLGGMAHPTLRALVEYESYDREFPKDVEIVKTGWDRMPRIIGSIRRECEALGAKFIIYVLPIPFDYDLRLRERVAQAWGVAPSSFDTTRPGRLSVEAFGRVGARSVDLSPRYRESGGGAALHGAADLHFSPRGHALTAEFLAGLER